jgi:ATP-dependent RNA helicase RhlE
VSAAKSFDDFKLNPQLRRAVEDLGYTEPTEIQVRAIPPLLSGQEVIGIAQTGTGKTAAFLLPILMKVRYAQGTEPRALILAPTKELVVQLADHATALARHTDLRITALYGGVGPKTQIATLDEGVDVVVSTPGRFMELYLKGALKTKKIAFLVIDEADRMMDMGFMPQLRKILEVIPVKRQNALFSATFPPKVEQLSAEFLEFPLKVEVTPQATPARQVQQTVYKVPNLKTKINLLEHLLADSAFTRVMIFTRTRQNADNVFKFIERKKLGPVRVIHANKSQNARINAVNQFRDGALRVLVSTDVTARGIDIAKVSHVINFDVPILYEDYVHRIGRTGRAFSEGEAITFVSPAEEYHLDKIQKLIRETIPVSEIPPGVEITETPFAERQAMAREIDDQRRQEDPTFRGAFHERKGKGKVKGKRR